MLGPTRGEYNEMALWDLEANGNVVPRHSLRPLQVSEIHSPSKVQKCKTFDHFIERRWGTSINPLKEPIKTNEDEIIGSGEKMTSLVEMKMT